MKQYQGLAAPLMPPTAASVSAGVLGSCLPPVRRVAAIACFVAACVLPSTLAEGTANPPTAWRPTYPNQIAAKVTHAQYKPAYFSLEGINPNPGNPGGGIIPTGSVPILQYQALAAPFTQPVGPPFTNQTWGSYADRVPGPRTLHASLHPAYVADKFTAPTAATVTALSWSPAYPNQIPRTAPVRLGSSELVSTTSPQIDLTWKPIYQDRYLQAYRLATYVWGQPHFVIEVPVPVESWTGVYLDNPVLAKARRQPFGVSGPLEGSLLTQPTPPPASSWDPTYPDFAKARAQSLAGLQSGLSAPPLFIPDQTNPVTVLSWSARYRDMVPAAARLRTGAQPAFAMDAQWTAPAVVAAPALAVATYPDRVYGRAQITRATDWTAPLQVADVTQVVTKLSWQPAYDDLVFRARTLPTAAQLALMMDAQIFIPSVPATPATGANNIGVPRRLRSVAVRGHQRTVRVPRRRRGESS